MAYDVLVEVNKIDRIVEVEKFNPYHDSKGRFTTAGGGGKFYATPGKSKAHDKAVDREKVRNNPYRHMKTTELEAKANDLTEKMNRAAETASMGTDHKSEAVRRKARQAEKQYYELQEQFKLVDQMIAYNSKYGNANDKNPF